MVVWNFQPQSIFSDPCPKEIALAIIELSKSSRIEMFLAMPVDCSLRLVALTGYLLHSNTRLAVERLSIFVCSNFCYAVLKRPITAAIQSTQLSV